jgi:hypothetical protein
MQYVKGTINMPLILSAESMTLLKWWIDAAHAVHDDCKGQTGAMVSFGSGMALSFSKKQMLNVKSSTEAEVVGVDDGLPLVLWTRYFCKNKVMKCARASFTKTIKVQCYSIRMVRLLVPRGQSTSTCDISL